MHKTCWKGYRSLEVTRVLLESQGSTRWLLALIKAVFPIRETRTPESYNSSAPSHWGSLAIWESPIPAHGWPPSDMDQSRGSPSFCSLFPWLGQRGGRYGWDTLPDVHPGLAYNRLQLPPSGVNYSNRQSPAKRGAIQDLCSHLYVLNINRHHVEVKYFTLSNHFVSDLVELWETCLGDQRSPLAASPSSLFHPLNHQQKTFNADLPQP